MQPENTQNIPYSHILQFNFFLNWIIHIATALGFLSSFNCSIVCLSLTLLFTACEKGEAGVAHKADTVSHKLLSGQHLFLYMYEVKYYC